MDQTMTPPTEPDDPQFDAEPAKWPTPIGILSIVFGSLSLTCVGLGGIAQFALSPQLLAMQARAENIPPPPSPAVDPIVVLFMLLGLLWQLPLIIGGVATTRRKAIGRPMHLLYAIGYIPIAIAGTVVGQMIQREYLNSPELSQWTAEHAGTNLASQFEMQVKMQDSGLAQMISYAIAGVFLAWPIFCLFWFGPKGRSDRALRIDEEDRLV